MIEKIVAAAKKNTLVNWFRNRFPRLFIKLAIEPLTKVRYHNEKILLSGKTPVESDLPSILLFTIQKCASTYTTKVLRTLAEANGMFCADLEAYFSVTSVDPIGFFNDSQNSEKVLNTKGRYLGPLRFPYPIPKLSSYKSILVLRDPRDVLTSFYYSKLYSHIVLSEEFLEDRKKYEGMDIDRFVTSYYPIVLRTYTAYCDKLIKNDSILIAPYEQMVTDFDSWLSDIIAYLDLPNVPEEVIDNLKAKESSIQASGDKYDHIRNKLPGEFRKKLKPETQRLLNEEFSEVLSQLGYQAV